MPLKARIKNVLVGSGELTSLRRIMASPIAAGAAISRFWEETCVRRNAVDLLQGTGLEQMGKELKFWCYRLDDVFPASTHALLVRQMNFIFDPVGVSESGRFNVKHAAKQFGECLQAPLCV